MKTAIADRTGGHEDWLHILGKWREETAAELTTLYEEWLFGGLGTAQPE